MKNNYRTVRVFVENAGESDGFNIYLDFSGQREFLMYHRHNGLLFNLLKDGVYWDDLLRWSLRKNHSVKPGRRKKQRKRDKKFAGMVIHLLDVIDAYMDERNTNWTIMGYSRHKSEIYVDGTEKIKDRLYAA